MYCVVLCRPISNANSYSYSLWLIVKDSNVTLNMPTRWGHPIKCDIEAIENVQKRATKLVILLKIIIYRLSSLFGFTRSSTEDYVVK